MSWSNPFENERDRGSTEGKGTAAGDTLVSVSEDAPRAEDRNEVNKLLPPCAKQCGQVNELSDNP